MKITHSIGIAIIIIVLLLIQNYNTNVKMSTVQKNIIQLEEKIAELENMNSANIQHCEEIVKIDNEIILRTSGMIVNIGKYCEQPELLILDGSVIISSTEQNIKQRNELLDELDIEYDEPIYNN